MSHAIDRALERYGVRLTGDDLRFIGDVATTRGHPCAAGLGKSRTAPNCFKVAVWVRGRWMVFVVNVDRTVLTALEEYEIGRFRKRLNSRMGAIRKMGLAPGQRHDNSASPA